jgi:hypothetical protein
MQGRGFLFTTGVALACEKNTLVGKSVSLLVVEGRTFFSASSLLLPMMRMNKFSCK